MSKAQQNKTTHIQASSVKNEAREKRPTILIVTPEITYLPAGMGNLSQRMSAKAGGMADVSSSLINALFEQGADVHVAIPNYKRMFDTYELNFLDARNTKMVEVLGEDRIHLANDRIFFYKDEVYNSAENYQSALAFQREIINNIIPKVKPDLIHCNDWMTGLIPPVAKKLGIPCLITVHNIHTEVLTMAAIEDRGIDCADYWENYYFSEPPSDYYYARENIAVDMMATGIFASDHVNTVSKTFLYEVVEGKHSFVTPALRQELANKLYSGNATGILNAPDASFNPANDALIENHYDDKSHVEGKAENKKLFQQTVGLNEDPNAPLFYWPSRLDPMQKGCQLLADILFQLTSDYTHNGLQIAIIASGSFEQHFHDIVNQHNLQDRVAVRPFNEGLSRLAYAAADFILMPSSFEPCGLPQMAAPIYGTLPVVHDTGGIHDTVEHLHYNGNIGNGFRFEHYSAEGFRWAIDEAVKFYGWDAVDRKRVIGRIMKESKSRFNHTTTASAYIELYGKMLGREVVDID